MLTALSPADGEAILPLAECKRHLSVLSTSQDALIAELRDIAVDWCEGFTRHALTRRAFELADKQFVSSLRLPRLPDPQVTAIAYRDADGAEIALDATAWWVGAGILQPGHGLRWPYASGRAGSVKITFTAGYATPAAIPRRLIAAVKFALAAMYEDRETPDLSAAERAAGLVRRRTL